MKKILLFISTIFILAFCSCKNDVNLTFNKDGSVKFEFSTEAGEAITKMLKDFSSENDADSIIDKKAIAEELTNSKFSNVVVSNTGFSNVKMSGIDKNKKSILFTTGILSDKSSKVKVLLTPKQLKKFYDDSEDSTQMLLDMLLSPVFNNEIMTENEYIEMVSSFYGAPVAQEIKNSFVNITIHTIDDEILTRKIPLVQLMTLNKPLTIE